MDQVLMQFGIIEVDASVKSERLPEEGLLEFRRGLVAQYGERLERAVLYGSRARGDARDDSDYDVAVFLTDMASYVGKMYKLSDMTTGILQDFGIVIHAMPFRAGSYGERAPIMHEIRKDGRDIFQFTGRKKRSSNGEASSG